MDINWSSKEQEVSAVLSRGFGLTALSNLKEYMKSPHMREGLVYSRVKPPLIRFTPIFDHKMTIDPKNFTLGVHNTIIDFVDGFDAEFKWISEEFVMLVFKYPSDNE